MIDSHSLKKGGWIMFFSAALFGVFGPSSLSYFWWVYLIFVVVFLGFVLYLIYCCERFVLYMSSLFLLAVGLFAYLACTVAYFTASAVLGAGNVFAVLLGLVPAIAVVLTVVIILVGETAFFPFECKGNRVITRGRQQKKTSYNVGLIVGVSVLASGVFFKSVDAQASNVLAVLICTGCSVAISVLSRHIIRGLRTLYIEERNMPVPYTFMKIEEIREARSRWWLGRLFKWMGSLRQSTGS
ncbi:hypothetical protein M5G20_14480 [Pseudomonas sp. TNT2022 ID1044]|uniref:hypothetical protein n=1 Tax=Pseudomonas sp. TNT2022 ID1044 TaxID=2942636 RepID=UPI002361D4C3|nr:hypothetical protein [Pseudomonas sp. TNT2022 ID1044]MDD0997063.1 hypothetical protein [Pseudomonas sp. TNT2022 ID1044]